MSLPRGSQGWDFLFSSNDYIYPYKTVCVYRTVKSKKSGMSILGEWDVCQCSLRQGICFLCRALAEILLPMSNNDDNVLNGPIRTRRVFLIIIFNDNLQTGIHKNDSECFSAEFILEWLQTSWSDEDKKLWPKRCNFYGRLQARAWIKWSGRYISMTQRESCGNCHSMYYQAVLGEGYRITKTIPANREKKWNRILLENVK